MRFELADQTLDKISSDAAIVFAFEEEKDKKAAYELLEPAHILDTLLKDELTRILKLERFSGKKGETVIVIPSMKMQAARVIVIGLGKKEKFSTDVFRRVAGKFAKHMKHRINSTSLVIPQELQNLVSLDLLTQVFGEGILLGSYAFDKYKKKKDEERKFTLVTFSAVSQSDQKIIHDGIAKAELYASATILARDLVNEQSFIATPTYLANTANEIAKKNPKNIKCTIFDKAQCEKMGMEAFLSIARAAGDDTPPKFIFLEYTPEKAKGDKKLALVGKGITFDTGGINVKPGDHMADMKMDKAGAAAVLGVFSVIADIKPTFPVMGVIAATPNLVSATSAVPGDVAKALNGKTIEILNTDAEGRVTMADSISYAVEKGATEIIDIATLTGAALVALGEDIADLFSNNHDLATRLKSAAHESGEKVWELPLEEEYKKLNKSHVADIANIPNTRYGGTITAALFLQEFIEKQSWAHLDIAGPAFLNKPSDISHKGGTGFGVRTLLNLLINKE